MTAFTKSLLATSVISLALGIYQWVQANRLKEEIRQLAVQTTELAAKTEEVTRERDEATRRASAVNEDLIRANTRLADMAALRTEVERLRPMEKSLRSIRDARAAASAELPRHALVERTLTRTFKVDAKTVTASLDRHLGTNVPTDATAKLRTFLTSSNVMFSPEPQLFFNDKAGIIIVKQTEENLAKISSAIDFLNALNLNIPQYSDP